MINTILIVDLEDLSNTNDSWAERFRRYDAQAKQDFAMYEWMEQQGKLPPPHRIGRVAVRKFHAAQQQQVSR